MYVQSNSLYQSVNCQSKKGPGVEQWLRLRATSRKVPGLIPGRVTGDFFRSIRQVHVPGVDSEDIPGGTDGR